MKHNQNTQYTSERKQI